MMKPNSGRFLWLALTLLPLVSLSFLLAVSPQDFWWLLQVGRETLQTGSVPLTDTISWSQAGRPIIYQQWLAGVIFYSGYQLGGITVVFLVRGLAIAFTYALLWSLLARASTPILATVLTVVLGFSTANNWSVRSQLLAYPLFAISVAVLYAWQSGGKKQLWLLPLAALLWVNLHGSFILLFVLLASALLFGDGDKKFLFWVSAATLLATLINPYGVKIWSYLTFMLQSPSDHLFAFEWAPPQNAGWQMNIFFAWLLVFAPLVAFAKNKLTKLEWLWFLGFGWLALSGLRYVIWFHFLLAIFSAKLLAGFFKATPPQKTFPAINLALGIFLLFLPLIFLTGFREKWMGSSIPVYETAITPLRATGWLIQHPEHCATLWADYAFGGYLAFAFPTCKPWMDSRFNAYPPEQWEAYVRVTNAEGWQNFFDENRIQNLFLSSAAQPKLLQAVSQSSDWLQIYKDDDAVFFTRQEEP
ncbi:MAG: hypothetical protein IT310_14435 [Anaerolineales bacterium]|nr:hypothetical protein [Anaerolineales bacterium]